MHDIVAQQIERNVAQVRERIAGACERAGRQPSDVTSGAAAKYVDAETVRALMAAGVRDIAENRLESLVSKQAELEEASDIRWHFIGRLQSRKVPEIAARVQSIHTLCTESAAGRLSQVEPIPELLVQVNTAGDPSKDGIEPADLAAFLEELPAGLQIRGLTTMPAAAEDPDRSRAAFRELCELASSHNLPLLSMGTTQDFEVAVEEGATHVRLGRVLFA
jgi:pyridoxal phosphate enzyme (YggS family)